jgi:hypothetical protein
VFVGVRERSLRRKEDRNAPPLDEFHVGGAKAHTLSAWAIVRFSGHPVSVTLIIRVISSG